MQSKHISIAKFSADSKNEKMIADYIKNQLEEDFAKDQISLKEFADPFTGERNK